MAVFGRVRKQAKVGEGSETSLIRTRALLRLRRSEVRSAKPPCYAGYRQPKKNYGDFIPFRDPERSLGYK